MRRLFGVRGCQVLIGDPSAFAIESMITRSFERLSQRALGYFVIHVAGRVFGVRSPEATLLACSFDAVCRRLQKRSEHQAPFSREPAASLADALLGAMYDLDREDELFFGMRSAEFSDSIVSNDILWAPDGDAAFDDGGHVLQFDEGDLVRLVAFKSSDDPAEVARTVVDQWMRAGEFYEVLARWRDQFEAEWNQALREQPQ